MQPHHDILLVLDGELAYVGVGEFGQFCVNRGGKISEHETLADALIAAAVQIGAVP